MVLHMSKVAIRKLKITFRHFWTRYGFKIFSNWDDLFVIISLFEKEKDDFIFNFCKLYRLRIIKEI